MSTTGPQEPALFPTLVKFARDELHCSPKLLRKAAAAGELKLYRFSDRWLRLYRPEALAWAKSKVMKITPHAAARLAEVIEREEREGRAQR